MSSSPLCPSGCWLSSRGEGHGVSQQPPSSAPVWEGSEIGRLFSFHQGRKSFSKACRSHHPKTRSYAHRPKITERETEAYRHLKQWERTVSGYSDPIMIPCSLNNCLHACLYPAVCWILLSCRSVLWLASAEIQTSYSSSFPFFFSSPAL